MLRPELTPRTPEPTIIQTTRAALLILEAAHRAGLATPTYVHPDPDARQVGFHFDTLSDLTEWAAWIDAPIGEYEYAGTIQHRVEGVVFDQSVRLAYVEAAGVKAS